MENFEIPSPTSIIPNDRSTFNPLWAETREKWEIATREKYLFVILDQLVEGDAFIGFSTYEHLDDGSYDVVWKLAEEFKSKGYDIERFYDGYEKGIKICFPKSNPLFAKK